MSLVYKKERDVVLAVKFFQLEGRKIDVSALKTAYRTLSKIHHPDMGGSHEQMVLLNKYYELLSSKVKNGAGFTLDAMSDKAERDAAEKIKNEMMKSYAYDVFDERFDVEKYLDHFEKIFGKKFEYRINMSVFSVNRVSVNISFTDPQRDHVFRIVSAFDVNENKHVMIGAQGEQAGYDRFQGVDNFMINTEATVGGKATKMTKERYQHVDADTVFQNPEKTFPSKKLIAGMKKILTNSYAKSDYLNTLCNKFSVAEIKKGIFAVGMGRLTLQMNRNTMTFGGVGGVRLKEYSFVQAITKDVNEKGKEVITNKKGVMGSVYESENRNEFKILIRGLENINKNFSENKFVFDNIQKYLYNIVRMQKIASFVAKSIQCGEQPPEKNIDFLKYFDLDKIKEKDVCKNKSREKMVFMKINDFINMSKGIDDGNGPAFYDPEEDIKIKNILESIKNGERLVNVPELGVNTSCDDGVARVASHEGRHRAMILAALGCEYMPVMIQTSSIRFSEQMEPDNYDYIEQWPDMMASEDNDFVDNFPVSREECQTRMIDKFIEKLHEMNGGKPFTNEQVVEFNKEPYEFTKSQVADKDGLDMGL